ncbi:hypothetical protein TrCOL_g2179 [Triparma columacea]|nr:hypothetical protein TrCOL_g2179 [Triparma columacea]
MISKSLADGTFHMLKELKRGGKVMGRGGRAEGRGGEAFDWPGIKGTALDGKEVDLAQGEGGGTFIACVSFKQFGYNVCLSWVEAIRSSQPEVPVYNVVVGEGGIMRLFQPMLRSALTKATPPDMRGRTVMYDPPDVREMREGLGIENTLTGYVYGVKNGQVRWMGAGEVEEGEVEELVNEIM